MPIAESEVDTFDLTRELEDLESISTPPCQYIRRLIENGKEIIRLCGKPSVQRIEIRCNKCKAHGRIFICQACLDKLNSGDVSCYDCMGDVLSWWII